MAAEPVTVIARIRAKIGLEDRVYQELTKLLAPTRAEAGCLNYDMHRNLEDPSLFLFHETWASEAALNRHFQTAHIAHWLSVIPEVCAEPLEVTRWTRVG